MEIDHEMDRVKRIWYLSPMQAAKVQVSSGEPVHLRSLARTFAARSYKQWVKRNLQTESLAPLNSWACTVKICNDGMLEDTNSLDGAQMISTAIRFKLQLSVILAKA